MLSSSDPYKLLGVGRRAPMSEVQRAFRRQVLRWHPDRHPHGKDGARRFQEIVHAYRMIRRRRRAGVGAPSGEVDGDWPLWATVALPYHNTRERSWAGRLRERGSAFVLRHVVVLSLSFSASASACLTAVGMSEPPPSPPGELNRAYAQAVYSSGSGSPPEKLIPAVVADEQ